MQINRYALKEIRERSGLSISQLAEAIDSSPGYLHDLDASSFFPHVSLVICQTTEGFRNGISPTHDRCRLVDVTAASGTSPTLDLTVEYLMDGGTTFAKADPADAFTQIVAAGVAVKSFVLKGTAYRIAWAIGGTTPSFTFSIDEIRR